MSLRSFYDLEQPPLRLLVKLVVPLFALSVIGVLATWGLIYGIAKRSEPVKLAESYVRSNVTIEKYLGKPREVSLWPVELSFNYEGTAGRASFGLSVTGEKATGMVYFRFTREVGIWRIDRVNLVTDSGRQVRLLPAALGHSESRPEGP